MDWQTPIALFLVALAAAALLSRQARAMGLWRRPAPADAPVAKSAGCQGCALSSSCSKPGC